MKEFEISWLKKFRGMITRVAGEDVEERVMSGSEKIIEHFNTQNVISWTKEAIDRLIEEVDKENMKEILTGCACHYPHKKLEDFRNLYAETGDIDIVHKLLQERFEEEIKEYKQLNDEQLEFIVSKGWGVAGKKEGNIIYAIKIPSKFHEYFNTTDDNEKVYYYCHCPRIREALKNNDKLTSDYCYCGAGFYQDIWQEILQKEVKVEVIRSLLNGDDVCQIKIYLPI